MTWPYPAVVSTVFAASLSMLLPSCNRHGHQWKGKRVPLTMSPRIWKKGKVYAVEEDQKGYPVAKRYGVTWKVK